LAHAREDALSRGAKVYFSRARKSKRSKSQRQLSGEKGIRTASEVAAKSSDEQPDTSKKEADSSTLDVAKVETVSDSPRPVEAKPDAVEAALADAISRTTDPTALVALTNELQARRLARANVVSLADRKRGAR
jgi:hypothetical protein